MKRTAMLLLTLLMLCLSGMACADGMINSKEQLNHAGIRIGVSTGSASVLIVERELPNATILYYTDDASGYEAVA